ncbi:hypothetical protein MES4922_30301 [Mesorhizobium ventifaucium]|uniref:Uncharacterized protein n=1 Tax=Mesorhizobium ventifaucium TaxID=666020 RepID=A0ABN8JW86_9HYPH|nr:hypothetical protein MES4922_30301 [Mesorhizobium ventifaucium]
MPHQHVAQLHGDARPPVQRFGDIGRRHHPEDYVDDLAFNISESVRRGIAGASEQQPQKSCQNGAAPDDLTLGYLPRPVEIFPVEARRASANLHPVLDLIDGHDGHCEVGRAGGGEGYVVARPDQQRLSRPNVATPEMKRSFSDYGKTNDPAALRGAAALHYPRIPAFPPNLQGVEHNLTQAAVEAAAADVIVLLIPANRALSHHVEVRVPAFEGCQDFYPTLADTNRSLQRTHHPRRSVHVEVSYRYQGS